MAHVGRVRDAGSRRLSLMKVCFIINGGRGRPLFALRPGANGDISLKEGQTSNEYIVWSQARGGTYLPSSVAYQGAIYTLTETGILNRFDAKTGKQIYKTRIDPAARISRPRPGPTTANCSA